MKVFDDESSQEYYEYAIKYEYESLVNSKSLIELKSNSILESISELRKKFADFRQEVINSMPRCHHEIQQDNIYHSSYSADCSICEWSLSIKLLQQILVLSEARLLKLKLSYPKLDPNGLILTLEALVVELKKLSFKDEYFSLLEEDNKCPCTASYFSKRSCSCQIAWFSSRLLVIDLGLKLIDPVLKLITELKQNVEFLIFKLVARLKLLRPELIHKLKSPEISLGTKTKRVIVKKTTYELDYLILDLESPTYSIITQASKEKLISLRNELKKELESKLESELYLNSESEFNLAMLETISLMKTIIKLTDK